MDPTGTKLYASPVSFMIFFAFVVCRLVLGYFALFVSDLSHSKSELHSICFFVFLTLWGRFRKILRSFLNRLYRLGNRTNWFIGFYFPK